MKKELMKFFQGTESLNFKYEWGSSKTYKLIEAKPIKVGEHHLDKETLREAKKRGLIDVSSNNVCSITKAGVCEYLNLLGITPDMYKAIEL